jgi:hypothetical protein
MQADDNLNFAAHTVRLFAFIRVYSRFPTAIRFTANGREYTRMNHKQQKTRAAAGM